jgi:hypothetical protein
VAAQTQVTHRVALRAMRYTPEAIICNVGTLTLSPSRRLRAVLCDERQNGVMLELQLQISADGAWAMTPQALRASMRIGLSELIELVERAIRKSPGA